MTFQSGCISFQCSTDDRLTANSFPHQNPAMSPYFSCNSIKYSWTLPAFAMSPKFSLLKKRIPHQLLICLFLVPKTHFLDVLEIFRLDIGQISFRLLEKAFASWQHAFLSTSIKFYDIFALGCPEIKFRESDLCLKVFIFLIFFAFPFSPFLIFLLQWLTFYWACFQFKTFQESIMETVRQFLPWSGHM